MDTTYFGRLWWITVFRDYHWKENLYYHDVKRESIQDYKAWIRKLHESWYVIEWIVCDWKKGMLWWFGKIPTQMCHFHQKAIIRRYITSKPKYEANIELKEITSMLWKASTELRIEMLIDRARKHREFLNEKNEKWNYIHEKSRKARRSLMRNKEYLFIYKSNSRIPNTTNALEWEFSHMKTRVRIHRWLGKEDKLKLCYQYLKKRN